MAITLFRYRDIHLLVGLVAGFALAFVPVPDSLRWLPARPVLTATILPIAYVLDHEHGRFFFEAFGFRQPLGIGAGLILALGFLGPSFWKPRAQPDPSVLLLTVVFVLLVLSAFRSASNPHAVDQLFGVLVPLAGIGRFGLASIAVHKLDGICGLARMVVIIAVSGGLLRWMLEGPGPSSSQYRAGVDWYVGPAVYASSALLPALPLAGWLVVTARSASQRVMFILAGTVVGLEIIWSERKLGIPIIALQGAVIVVASLRRNDGTRQEGRRQRRRALLAAGAAILMVIFSFRVLTARLGALYGGDLIGNASDEGRLQAQRAFLQASLERPGGWGLNGLGETGRNGFLGAHNTLLTVAVDAGLVAAAILAVWLIGRLVWLGRRAAPGATLDLVFIRVAAITALLILVIDGPEYFAHPLPSGAGLMLALSLAHVPRPLSTGGRDDDAVGLRQ